MPSVADLAATLDALLGPAASGERTVVVRDPRVPVRRLGLALEPDAATAAWARDERLDALLLHRHWRLDLAALPPHVGLLASHAPFDEALGLGPDPWLAAALGGTIAATFGERDGAPLGMLVALPAPVPATALVATITAEFGGLEAVVEGTADRVAHVASARAMTDALVREAAALGAGLWLTGQLRRPGEPALRATGLHAVAVGHRRSEQWALALLGRLLGAARPEVQVVVHG